MTLAQQSYQSKTNIYGRILPKNAKYKGDQNNLKTIQNYVDRMLRAAARGQPLKNY
jgi:hypothetical protein